MKIRPFETIRVELPPDEGKELLDELVILLDNAGNDVYVGDELIDFKRVNELRAGLHKWTEE